MKRLRMKRVVSPNGEVHYVVEESEFLEPTGHIEYFDESEIRKITKREASKPLFLVRGAE